MTGSHALSGLGTDLEQHRTHGTYTFGAQCKCQLTLVEIHGISGEVVVRNGRYRSKALSSARQPSALLLQAVFRKQ